MDDNDSLDRDSDTLSFLSEKDAEADNVNINDNIIPELIETNPDELPDGRLNLQVASLRDYRQRHKGIGRKMKILRLPDSIYRRMLTYIKMGCFDHHAATAVGVNPETFSRWITRGEQDFFKNKRTPYSQLYQDVTRVKGEAIVVASLTVKQDSPLQWLQRGPGKGTVLSNGKVLPGWGDPEKLIIEQQGTITNRNLNLNANIRSDIPSIPSDATDEDGNPIPESERLKFEQDKRETVAKAFGFLEELGLIQATQQGAVQVHNPEETTKE